MERRDIEEQFKWDLSHIYKNEKEFYKDYEYVQDNISILDNYKGIFTNNSNIFLEFMKIVELLSCKLTKMYNYAHLAIDVEPDNIYLQDKYSKSNSLIDLYNEATVFVKLEIIDNKENILRYINEPDVIKYKRFIYNAFKEQPYILDNNTEYLLSKVTPILDTSHETYNVFRLDFKPVIINGKEHFLNHATLTKFLKNKDTDIRKQAYENLYSEYKKYSNVFATTLIGNMKKNVFLSEARKFNSPLEYSLFSDNVPKELFHKVLDMANNKFHSYLQDYIEIRKKVLNKQTLKIYDLTLPLVEPVNKEYSLNDAFRLIIDATKNLGIEYQNVLTKAKSQRWIDYFTHSTKRHGAYNMGVYDVHPYILTNYTNDLESVFTLIHELGHSVHSYWSSKEQPYINHNYKIFVAEVASTVNENLLMNLLIEKANTKQNKAFLLYRKIEENIGLLYRQPFFANFENILYNKLLNGESVSNQDIISIYENLNKVYWGNNVELNELTKFSCYSVPHFYYNYYVYKYTVGMCVSTVIAKKIISNDKEYINKYLNFLKSGGSKDPVDLLIDAGVDPLDDNIYFEAFNNFKNLLDEFNSLIK